MKKNFNHSSLLTIISLIFIIGCNKDYDDNDTDDEKLEKKLLLHLNSLTSTLSKNDNKEIDVQNNLSQVYYKYEDDSMSYYYDLIIEDSIMLKNIDARIFQRGFFGYQNHKPNKNGTIYMTGTESAKVMVADINKISVDVLDKIKNNKTPDMLPLNLPLIDDKLDLSNIKNNTIVNYNTKINDRIKNLLLLYQNKEYAKFLLEHKKISIELTLAEFKSNIKLNNDLDSITAQTFFDGFLKIPNHPIPIINYNLNESNIKKSSKRIYFNKIYNQAILMDKDSFYKIIQALFLIDQLNPNLFNSYLSASKFISNYSNILNDPIIKVKHQEFINLMQLDPGNLKKLFLEAHINYNLETNYDMNHIFNPDKT